MALKYADDVPIGSANFVLMRHGFRLAGKETIFFILYFHIQREDPKRPRVGWMAGADKAPWWEAVQRGEVAYPDFDLGGGEVIGHVGHAGPRQPGRPDARRGDVGQGPGRRSWARLLQVDRRRRQRPAFCEVGEIISAIDKPKGRGDGQLSEAELRAFFQRDATRTELRKAGGAQPVRVGRVRRLRSGAPAQQKSSGMTKGRALAPVPRPDRADALVHRRSGAASRSAEGLHRLALPSRALHRLDERAAQKQATVTAVIQVNSGPAAAKVLDDRDSLEGFTDEEDEMSARSQPPPRPGRAGQQLKKTVAAPQPADRLRRDGEQGETGFGSVDLAGELDEGGGSAQG